MPILFEFSTLAVTHGTCLMPATEEQNMSLNSQKPQLLNSWNRSTSSQLSAPQIGLSSTAPPQSHPLSFSNHLHTCGLFWKTSAARKLVQLYGHLFLRRRTNCCRQRDLLMTHIHSFLGSFLRNSGYTGAEADTAVVAATAAYLMFVTIPLMQAL